MQMIFTGRKQAARKTRSYSNRLLTGQRFGHFIVTFSYESDNSGHPRSVPKGNRHWNLSPRAALQLPKSVNLNHRSERRCMICHLYCLSLRLPESTAELLPLGSWLSLPGQRPPGCSKPVKSIESSNGCKKDCSKQSLATKAAKHLPEAIARQDEQLGSGVCIFDSNIRIRSYLCFQILVPESPGNC